MRILLMFFLIGMALSRAVFADTTSTQFRITNPQAILHHPNSGSENTVAQRLGQQARNTLLQNGFYATSVYNHLKVKLSTALLELEHNTTVQDERVAFQADGSQENIEQVLVTQAVPLQKQVSYQKIFTHSETGTSGDLFITVPHTLRSMNRFLGTIVISVAAY